MERRGLPTSKSPNGIDITGYVPYNHYKTRRTSLEIPQEEEISLNENSTHSNYHTRGNYENTSITAESVYKSLLQKKPGGSVYSYSGASSARAKIQRSQHVPKPARLVEIPKDGNLSGLSCRDICSILSCMKFSPSIIARIKNHRINGKAFAKLTDDDLRDLGINNAVVQHFRNKSKRNHGIFML